MERKTPLELGGRYFTRPKSRSSTLSALSKCSSPLSHQLTSATHWMLSERRTPTSLLQVSSEEHSFRGGLFSFISAPLSSVDRQHI